MDSTSFITSIEQAGFALAMNGDRLRVTPASKLSDPQREFIASHRDALIQAVRLRDKVLESSSAGNDIAPANNDRILIHIPEFKLQNGNRVSFDSTVPKANLERLRQVVKFTLIDDQGGGSILGEPSKSRAELVDILKEKYGDRLESIDHQHERGITQ